MKFELTFKVVLLFSYQGFAFMRKLLYFITSTLVCQELFKFFQLLFRSYLISFFHLFQRKLFFYVVQLLYFITHFYLVKNFFIYLKIFFPISFKSMCSHVQRMLFYHNNIITSSFFIIFSFLQKALDIISIL